MHIEHASSELERSSFLMTPISVQCLFLGQMFNLEGYNYRSHHQP